MEYEWWATKAESNLGKLGVEFLDAVIVFDHDRAITLADEHPGEERVFDLRHGRARRVLAISYALRGSIIRIISTRKATARERAEYEDKRI